MTPDEQATHLKELLAAESRRVDVRFEDVYRHMEKGFASLSDKIVSQVDRIDSLITASSARADTTAVKLEEGVRTLAQTVTNTTETTRLAAADAVAATTLAFDNRLKPVEDAMRVAAGRGSLANPLLLSLLGTLLALGGAVVSTVLR